MLGKALIGLGVGTATAGLGTVGGAYAGQSDGNAATGATIGAAAGLGAGVGAVAIGANAGSIAKGVGMGTWNMGKKAWGAVSSETARAGYVNFGKGALAVSKKVGIGAGVVGGIAATTGTAAAIKAGAKYGNIAASMFKMNPEFSSGKGGLLKMSKRGMGMLGAGAIVQGGVEAFKVFDSARAGTSDGQVMTATPVAARSSQMRNAGATGDLAFAMRAQRHG